jgi:uncharacterized protein YkwD
MFAARSFLASCIAASSLLTACTGDVGDDGDNTKDDGSGASSSGDPSGPGSGGDGTGGGGASAQTSSGGAGATGAASSGGSGGGTGGTDPGQAVCDRWTSDRTGLTEGSWSGSVNACDPGDISADAREDALTLVNLYRWLAALPPVTTDPTRNAKTQACALMMHANGQLSHNPPMSWDCYSADGAQAAGNSNIASTPGVSGVDLYMADPGNDTTIGHRRWILSGSLGPIGLGSTTGASCMWVLGGSGPGAPPFTAWPSPGYFPLQAMQASFVSVDQTGWTIQSDSIDLGSADVTITDGGNDKPVSVASLAGGYGSTYAIKITPQGWTTEAGHTYSVSVSGVSQPIAYDVSVVDCSP